MILMRQRNFLTRIDKVILTRWGDKDKKVATRIRRRKSRKWDAHLYLREKVTKIRQPQQGYNKRRRRLRWGVANQLRWGDGQDDWDKERVIWRNHEN